VGLPRRGGHLSARAECVHNEIYLVRVSDRLSVNERVVIGPFEGINVQVDIQVGPMKMARVKEEHVVNF
jgi:hypothetical protein